MLTLPQIIHAEIAANRVIPFARFMELALYCPEYGYYEQQKDTVGRRGDFITSVSTGELFGQLLAFQFAIWLDELRATNRELRIVEAGAHDGKLACDILKWLQINRADLFAQLEYHILEPSTVRKTWQQKTLREFSNVRWLSQLNNSQTPTFNGIIFSNELLDAFPVHRYGWNAENRTWFEWGVTVEGEKFVWAKIPDPDFRIQNPELEAVLPDNYTVETCPAAENWWRQAARVLASGKLLAIDYGFTEAERFSPARTNGTLRAYFRHHVSDDLLANPGEQDLTAHVNFSAIQQAGEAVGLTTENFQTQPQFLTRILEKATQQKSFGEWNASRTRQFQTLTHPEHLGRAFRVLVQSRCNS
ncbi:MAG: SAM-dependent methyltransferase [Limisphaerales bacterium]